jgi:peroxiredoxin
MKSKLINYILLVSLAVAGIYLYLKYKNAPNIELEKLPLTDLSENKFNINQLRGKKLLFSFGASWCINCLDELNDLKTIKNTTLKDVEVVVISDEPYDRIINFQEAHAYPFLFLKLNQAFSTIGINSIPTSYIVNTSFQIKKKTVGFIDWRDVSTAKHLLTLME